MGRRLRVKGKQKKKNMVTKSGSERKKERCLRSKTKNNDLS